LIFEENYELLEEFIEINPHPGKELRRRFHMRKIAFSEKISEKTIFSSKKDPPKIKKFYRSLTENPY